MILHTACFGILSTQSARLEGYPFGSIVPFSTDRWGRPVVLISRIAEHTRNIDANSRVALTVLEDPKGNVQAKGRISIVGKMEPVPEENSDCQQRYYRYFPNSKGYHQAHDFDFYYLEALSIRYIGGFGKIHWVEGKDFQLENPFFGTDEKSIVDHMNEDHQSNLKDYCRYFKQITVTEEEVNMVGIDSEGFNLLVHENLIRFTFKESIATALEARQALVAMAKETRTV